MKDSKNILTIVIIVVSASLLVGLFIYFGGSNSPVNSDLQAVANPIGDEILTKELLSAFVSVRDLKLDQSFFEDNVFKTLNDYSADLKDENKGRSNPFLPVGSVGTSVDIPASVQNPAN